MAHLRQLGVYCDTDSCGKKAVVEVVDRFNELCGKFCRRHGFEFLHAKLDMEAAETKEHDARVKDPPALITGYHVGDCRELLRQLPDESIHCVVTSPPYFGLRDYNTGKWEGGDADCAHTYKAGGTAASTLDQYDNGLTRETIENKVNGYGHATYRQRCGKCGARRVDQQVGLESSPEEYVATMVEVFREVRRVLRATGTCWINLGDSYAGGGHGGPTGTVTLDGSRRNMDECRKVPRRRHENHGLKPKDLIGIPWRVAFALQADGWYLRSDIIWAKPNPMPESVTDRPTKSHEYLFLLSKNERYYYDADAIRERGSAATFVARRRPDGQPTYAQLVGGTTCGATAADRNRRSVWTIASEPTPDAHFATFPRKLVEPCILAGCAPGGLVLDPFGGSGTVGRVAEDLGRRWLLFDLNPEYAKIAKRKTAQMGLGIA